MYTALAKSFPYYYITPCMFYLPALADDFSLEFEGQQVSPNLPDSSQFTGPSK